ncbi:hypothetical protein [Streptomyces sp. NPDC091385]|uniref:hypothetical protein n=1 Tax=Streptomyces sp. NPDC091385 TaxID=3365997 RepID=UPI00380915CB
MAGARSRELRLYGRVAGAELRLPVTEGDPPRALGTATVHDQDGIPRLPVPRSDWSALLDLALAETAQYGAETLQITAASAPSSPDSPQ